MKRYHTIIVGGGPSGMAAALAGAREGQRVLLVDRCDKIGKKILVTGNGKCNLTNLVQSPVCYRGDAPDLAGSIFSEFGLSETKELFDSLGLYTKERNGYVYPYNEQAASVREAFEIALQQNKLIDILLETDVNGIKKQKDGFLVSAGKTHFFCHSLILATGGLAGPKLGCDGSGYVFAKKMGHHIIKPLPALTALKSGAPFLKKISGVRNQAQITLFVEGQPVAKETGELQWTDYGISGVAVFQVSRFAIVALEQKKSVSLSLDFVPEKSEEDMANLLETYKKHCPYKTAQEFLNGFFPSKLVPVLLREARWEQEQLIKDWKEENMIKLTEILKHFQLRINGYMGYEKAQVTRGGVDLRELTTHLESCICPGLFFAGEVTDIDGTCGGYNLQWAFSSGSVAGEAAFKRNQIRGAK